MCNNIMVVDKLTRFVKELLLMSCYHPESQFTRSLGGMLRTDNSQIFINLESVDDDVIISVDVFLYRSVLNSLFYNCEMNLRKEKYGNSDVIES